jgi:hypothetical protein
MSYTDTRKYARGTELTTMGPWATYRSGRALCPDGKVRALARISITADTFFSIPAAVKVNGRTVSGYVSIDDTDTVDDGATFPGVVVFRAYTYRKNADAFAVAS